MCTFLLMLPISVCAVTMESVKGESNYVKISPEQLLSHEGITIELSENNPVRVEFSDGRIETFTYTLEDVGRKATKASGITKTASVERCFLGGSMTLWGDATWENRSLSFDDDVFLDYWGLSTTIEQEETWVTKRTGDNSEMAKGRTRGVSVVTEPITGTEYHRSFDFEIWLDPVDSSTAYLHINK